MTIPIEEFWALRKTRSFLEKILTMNITEIRKNSREIRKQAICCLRHYPFDCHLEERYKEEIEGEKNASI